MSFDGTMIVICLPRRRNSADKIDEALGQYPLTVDDPVVQVKIPEPRPVPGGPKIRPLQEDIAVRVGLKHLSTQGRAGWLLFPVSAGPDLVFLCSSTTALAVSGNFLCADRDCLITQGYY